MNQKCVDYPHAFFYPYHTFIIETHPPASLLIIYIYLFQKYIYLFLKYIYLFLKYIRLSQEYIYPFQKYFYLYQKYIYLSQKYINLLYKKKLFVPYKSSLCPH